MMLRWQAAVPEEGELRLRCSRASGCRFHERAGHCCRVTLAAGGISTTTVSATGVTSRPERRIDSLEHRSEKLFSALVWWSSNQRTGYATTTGIAAGASVTVIGVQPAASPSACTGKVALPMKSICRARTCRTPGARLSSPSGSAAP